MPKAYKILFFFLVSTSIILTSTLVTYKFLSPSNQFFPFEAGNIFTPGEIVKKFSNTLPKPFIVYSGSMDPTIKTASLILSQPSKIYVPGDIVTFLPSDNYNTPVTHRIESKLFPDGVDGEPIYQTSGDANDDFDQWKIKNQNIIGKVIFTLPFFGHLADFAKKPYGFILLVVVPATIFVYEELKLLKNQVVKSIIKLKSTAKQDSPRMTSLETSSSSSEKEKGLPKALSLIPLIGAFIVLVGVASAFYFDQEVSTSNVFGAAESFEELVTPTPSPVYNQ